MIIGGGVDLSILYVLNASGIILTILTGGQNGPLIWVIPVLIVLVAVVGLINGIGIAVMGVSPIIMTLGKNVIVEGALLVYLGGQQASKAPPLVVQWTFNTVGPVPVNTLIWFGLALLATAALSWTTFGRRLYALGTSRIVAEFSGINVVPIMIATYMICAVTAAVAGFSTPDSSPSPTSAWATPSSSPRSRRSRWGGAIDRGQRPLHRHHRRRAGTYGARRPAADPESRPWRVADHLRRDYSAHRCGRYYAVPGRLRPVSWGVDAIQVDIAG